MNNFPLAPLGTLISSPIADGPHTTPEFLSEGIPFLSVDGIQDGELVFNKCRFISPEDHDEFSKKAKPQKGDVLMGKAASTGKIALVRTDFEFSIWSPLAIIRSNDAIISDFLAFALKSIPAQIQIDNLCSYNTQKNIAMSDIPRIRIPLPPFETQRRIADYLDRETAEIDAAVAELDKYVELLRIRKSIFSNDSVWRNAAGRKRLKFLIDEVDERAGTDRTDWPLLSVSIHDGVNERLEDKTRIQASSDNLQNYKVVRVNDIVLNRMRAFQGALGRSRSEGITSPDYAVLRAHDVSAAEWIAHAMKTSDFINQITMRIRGIGTVDQGNARTPRINVAQLFDLEIPFPDADHREEIVDQLKREQEEMSLLLSSATKLRNLLLKRRSVLITDVVTGRKQV